MIRSNDPMYSIDNKMNNDILLEEKSINAHYNATPLVTDPEHPENIFTSEEQQAYEIVPTDGQEEQDGVSNSLYSNNKETENPVVFKPLLNESLKA